MGARVGIVGLNGSGKSTLVKLVTDQVKPTKGTVSRHPRLKLGYYSQDAIETLRAEGLADPSMTALTKLGAETGGDLDEGEIRGLLSCLNLSGSVVSHTPVSKLSGGQLVCLFWHLRSHLRMLSKLPSDPGSGFNGLFMMLEAAGEPNRC